MPSARSWSSSKSSACRSRESTRFCAMGSRARGVLRHAHRRTRVEAPHPGRHGLPVSYGGISHCSLRARKAEKTNRGCDRLTHFEGALFFSGLHFQLSTRQFPCKSFSNSREQKQSPQDSIRRGRLYSCSQFAVRRYAPRARTKLALVTRDHSSTRSETARQRAENLHGQSGATVEATFAKRVTVLSSPR